MSYSRACCGDASHLWDPPCCNSWSPDWCGSRDDTSLITLSHRKYYHEVERPRGMTPPDNYGVLVSWQVSWVWQRDHLRKLRHPDDALNDAHHHDSLPLRRNTEHEWVQGMSAKTQDVKALWGTHEKSTLNRVNSHGRLDMSGSGTGYVRSGQIH
jgi:hypothetical protein